MQPDAAIGKLLLGGRQPIGGPADWGMGRHDRAAPRILRPITQIGDGLGLNGEMAAGAIEPIGKGAACP